MIDPQEPAFPHHEVWDNEKPDIGWISGGLTKREYFAASVIRGIIEWDAKMNESRPDRSATMRNMVEAAVKLADSLIAELNKPQGDK